MKNRCMYLIKQVHPFDKTGAPVLEKGSLTTNLFLYFMVLLQKICVPLQRQLVHLRGDEKGIR